MFAEPKESMRMMCYQVENINKDTGNVRKRKIKVLEFKST